MFSPVGNGWPACWSLLATGVVLAKGPRFALDLARGAPRLHQLQEVRPACGPLLPDSCEQPLVDLPLSRLWDRPWDRLSDRQPWDRRSWIFLALPALGSAPWNCPDSGCALGLPAWESAVLGVAGYSDSPLGLPVLELPHFDSPLGPSWSRQPSDRPWRRRSWNYQPSDRSWQSRSWNCRLSIDPWRCQPSNCRFSNYLWRWRSWISFRVAFGVGCLGFRGLGSPVFGSALGRTMDRSLLDRLPSDRCSWDRSAWCRFRSPCASVSCGSICSSS